MQNSEKEVKLHSIIVHETDTGYAQCFKEDAYNESMGKIELEKIVFSNQIKNEWQNQNLWEKILNNQQLITPKFI